MKARSIVLLSGVLVVASFACAWAQEFSVGASAGVSMAGDVETPAFAPGVHARYEIPDRANRSSYFFELGATIFSDTDSDTEDGIRFDFDLDVAAISLVGGILAPLANDWRFYVLGGGGYFITDADIGIDDREFVASFGAPGVSFSSEAEMSTKDSFGLILGAGADYQLSDNLKLFLDFRYNFLNVDAEFKGSVSASYRGRTETESFEDKFKGRYNHGIARFGLSYIF